MIREAIVSRVSAHDRSRSKASLSPEIIEEFGSLRCRRFGDTLGKLHFNPAPGRRVDPVADPVEAIGDAVPEMEMMDQVLFDEIETQGAEVGNDLLPRFPVDATAFDKGRGQEVSATVPRLAAPLGLPLDIHAISVV